MMESKRNELIAGLIRKTLSNQIQWQEISDESYRAKIGPGLVRIERSLREWGDDPEMPKHDNSLDVWVINSRGGIADHFSRNYQGEELRLFEAARHSASNATGVYDDMLQALNG